MLSLLQLKGANVKALDKREKSPLHLAAFMGKGGFCVVTLYMWSSIESMNLISVSFYVVVSVACYFSMSEHNLSERVMSAVHVVGAFVCFVCYIVSERDNLCQKCPGVHNVMHHGGGISRF